jgi:ACS family D-galactonate transporter-like MFS transporter
LDIAAGCSSQRLLARGISSRVARGILGGACVAFGGAALAIMAYVPGISAKIALTTIGVTLPPVIYVISNAVVSEITPVGSPSAPLLAPRSGCWRPTSWAASSRRQRHRLTVSIPASMICGVIMLVGVIGMMPMRPERETMRWASKMPEVAVGPG